VFYVVVKTIGDLISYDGNGGAFSRTMLGDYKYHGKPFFRNKDVSLRTLFFTCHSPLSWKNISRRKRTFNIIRSWDNIFFRIKSIYYLELMSKLGLLYEWSTTILIIVDLLSNSYVVPILLNVSNKVEQAWFFFFFFWSKMTLEGDMNRACRYFIIILRDIII